jgi:hypothetical protein
MTGTLKVARLMGACTEQLIARIEIMLKLFSLLGTPIKARAEKQSSCKGGSNDLHLVPSPHSG